MSGNLENANEIYVSRFRITTNVAVVHVLTVAFSVLQIWSFILWQIR